MTERKVKSDLETQQTLPNQEVISHLGQPIALVFRRSLQAEGVNFLTPVDYTLQLGLIEHPTGHVIRDHIHRQDLTYRVDTTQEFLYIEKGKVSIDLYSDEWEKLEQIVLAAGDFILFIGGGHGLEILEDCRIIEIKQGPYPGDGQAKVFRNE